MLNSRLASVGGLSFGLEKFFKAPDTVLYRCESVEFFLQNSRDFIFPGS